VAYLYMTDNPDIEEIEELAKIVRITHDDQERGLELQEKHGKFCTSFGLKAAMYERLKAYLSCAD